MKNPAIILNLDNALFNLGVVAEKAKDSALYAVVKSDAYGHGALGFSEFLAKHDVNRFVVGSVSEGEQLRERGVGGEILVLGATPKDMVEKLSYFDLSQNVFCAEYARELAVASKAKGVKVKIHIEVDTGMNRLGFSWFDAAGMVAACSVDTFETVGIFTHFGSADGGDSRSEMRTRLQAERFLNCLRDTEKIGFARGMAHCCNSAALFRYPQYRMDAVRVGGALYGIGGVKGLKPVLSMRAPLLQVKSVKHGDFVGYGLKTMERPAKLGVVGVGYGHGISRKLSDKGSVQINGQKCAIVGRICMDFLTVDLTGVEAEVGDDAWILCDAVLAATIAKLGGTIDYETTTALSDKIQRIFTW